MESLSFAIFPTNTPPMPSFSDSFWSDNLSSGLDVLFQNLYKGCDQCDSFIQLFASRMQYEVSYGRQLCAVRSGIDIVDTNNSTSNALDNIIKQTELEGEQHLTIASNIESLVLKPFSQWCNDHRKRIKYSQKTLTDNIKVFQKSNNYVKKLSMEYIKNCKKLEDWKRIHFNDDDSYNKAMKSLECLNNYKIQLEREKENLIFGEIGKIEFDNKSLRQLLKLLLLELPKTEYKLPLINFNLQNTNNGYEITKFLLENMLLKDFDQAEEFGQDLLNFGFLKYCNGMGNSFVNSKKFQYQWRDYAYNFAQVPIPNKNNEDELSNSSQIERYLSQTKKTLATIKISDNIPLNSNQTNATDNQITSLEEPTVTEYESELFKLLEDVAKSDSKYFKECHKMDSLRCSIEELMIDHLSFMEKCELDRLKAIKKATLDFCSTIGNKIAIMKLQIDKIIDYQDTIDPENDLLELITTYNTGLFQPKVITYNNYYNPGIYQNFGIDLETRCRLDKKVVPLIISVLLSRMDQIYPDLENDKIRVSAWIDRVKLSLTHELRKKLNQTQFKEEAEILNILAEGQYEPSVIASVIKLYLLELPEPLISNELLDILRALYEKYPPTVGIDVITEPTKDNDKIQMYASDNGHNNDNVDNTLSNSENKRITGLYTTLSSLSKPHLATLDAITTHFYRLCKIIKMANPKKKCTPVLKEDTTINNDTLPTEDMSSYVSAEYFVNEISREFANCIIHAKVFDDNNLGFKIFHDLLTYKKLIFKQLKRQVSTTKS